MERNGLWWYHQSTKLSNPRSDLRTPCYVIINVLLIKARGVKVSVACHPKNFSQYATSAEKYITGVTIKAMKVFIKLNRVCREKESNVGRPWVWWAKERQEQRRHGKSTIGAGGWLEHTMSCKRTEWEVLKKKYRDWCRSQWGGRKDNDLLADWLPRGLMAYSIALLLLHVTPWWLGRPQWQGLGNFWPFGWERSILLQIWKPHAQGFSDSGVYRMLPIVRPWVLTPGPDPIFCRQNMKHRVLFINCNLREVTLLLFFLLCYIFVTSIRNSSSFLVLSSLLLPSSLLL